jgi:ABC-2 type transport system ATP-binding protein
LTESEHNGGKGRLPAHFEQDVPDDELPDENQVVRVVRLSKFFGTLQALRQVSLTAERGDIYGLIGPNGAGKTTLLRILATLIYPNYGSAYVCGHPVSTGTRRIRRLIGYMPDAFGNYEELTAEEYLRFYAALFHIPAAEQQRVISEVLDITSLLHKRGFTVSRLSRGMQQRLQVARVLLHDPKVLLLDEPASGLDPRARIDLKEILRRLRNIGKTVIISSHVLSDLHGFVNKIGIIERGKMLFSGSVDELTRGLVPDKRYEVGLAGEAEQAAELLSAHESVLSAEAEDSRVFIHVAEDGPDAGFFPRVLIREGFKVTRMEEKALDLQEAFLLVTKGLVS